MRKIQYLIRFGLLAVCAVYAFASPSPSANVDAESPDFPVGCAKLEVGADTEPTRGHCSIGDQIHGPRIDGCVPDTSSIPWLVLEVVTSNGPGVFAETVFIQRVHTTGGLKPTVPGVVPGQMKWVPYAAEYVFYSEK